MSDAAGAPHIVVRLDVMLARRKMTGKALAATIGITEQNLSLLRAGRVKGVKFETLARICAALDCQPGDLLEAVHGDRDDRDDHVPRRA
ncbi:MAG: helix-turn-helix domain-containing protein [Shimia sp.]